MSNTTAPGGIPQSNLFELDELTRVVDVGWVLLCTSLVFLMQGGFILLEIGSVRAKNAKSILLKNLLDSAATLISWWVMGYRISTGNMSTPFNLGVESLPTFTFGWTFCATATTIVSGCVAERTRLSAYVPFSIVLSGIIYPVVVRWVWHERGFLSHGTKELPWLKFHDFAGSVVVHTVGGTAGLVFAHLVGPRLGRFVTRAPTYTSGSKPLSRGFFSGWSWRGRKKESKKKYEDDGYEDESMLEGHDPSLVAIGTFVLWFGWYGFNAGSTGQLSDGGAELAARAVATTSMSGAGAVLMAVILNFFQIVHFTPQVLCNALLSGLVSITASCTIVELWSALLIGALGASFAAAADKLVTRMQIDDPLQAFAVHGASGIWGGVAVGIFGAEWSTHPASWEQFASQVIGLLIIMSWTAVMSVVVLFFVHGSLRLMRVGGLRVPASEELEGLDTLFTTHLIGGGKKARGVVAPEGVITVVSTDIQGSTSLWASEPQSMSACTALHDHIMRSELARFGGYEITTEGDAFLIAFNSPVSAVNFCTHVQTALLRAEWPEGIMDFPDCCQVYHLDDLEDAKRNLHDNGEPDETTSRSAHRMTGATNIDMSLFHLGGVNPQFLNDTANTERGVLVHRGLRVRMGIDIGLCKRQLHPTTRTFRYKGAPIVYAKALVGAFPSGGIVAMTHRVQAELAGQMSLLKGSSLCHLGVHVMSDKVRAKCGIFAIVPSELEARLLRMKPLDVKFEISPGYLSAPGVMPAAEVEPHDSTRPWERPKSEPGALTRKLVKRETLSVHCHKNPDVTRPIIIAFASLVLVEEMQTSAPNGTVMSRVGSSTLSNVIQRITYDNDASDKEGGASQEGSVRQGVAYLSAMLGGESLSTTSVMRPGTTSAEDVDASHALNLVTPGEVGLSSSEHSVLGVSRHSRRGGDHPLEPTSDLSVCSGSRTSTTTARISSTSARISSFMSSPASNPMMESLRNEAQRLAGPLIRMSLATTNGYECQEDEGTYMVSFESALDATRWGSMLCRIIDNMFGGRFSVAVGMHWAMPTSISPHVSSGRADYFGTVVNAAARVHSLAATRTCTYGRSTTIVSQETFEKIMEIDSNPAANLYRTASQEASNSDADMTDDGGKIGKLGGTVGATTTAAEEENMRLKSDIAGAADEEHGASLRRFGSNSHLSATSTGSGAEIDDDRSQEGSRKPVLDKEAEYVPPISPTAGPSSTDGGDNFRRGMLFTSVGKHRLKGFSRPIELFTAVLPEELSFDMLHLEETIVGLSKSKTGEMFEEEITDPDGSVHYWDGEKYATKSSFGERNMPDYLAGNSAYLSDDDK